ncbi:TonB-dependent receptor [Roseimarinus sediminis]|uniref:TonB-dependent receptor n=1 Tax=Roseimarinus sediminis TaxID=1610899 RepID=UPI003D1D75D2
MKLTIFLLFVTLAQSFAIQTYSQATKLSLEMRAVSVRDVLNEIEANTEFYFLYSSNVVNVDRIVDVKTENQPIQDVLRMIFDESDVKYDIFDRQIVLSDKNSGTQTAQNQIVVGGTVSNTSGEVMPGVTVVLKGTTIGVISDADGKYTLRNVPDDGVLQFSFIGMQTSEVPINGQQQVDVVMYEDIIGLEEIVAVGYGVQKKSDVTGAMVSVSSEDLTSRPVSNALEALQGKAAGVDITSNERPGEIGTVRIRGVRSLTATSDPLYVVDGVPLMSASSIETMNTRDFESIDILKDASATAIYGSRGANGVILITTKQGQSGKIALNYSGTLTMENIIDRAPMMDAGEYLTWRRWAWYNADPDKYPAGNQPTIENDKVIFYEAADPATWKNIEKGWSGNTWDGSKVTSTDWTDYVTQTALIHDHTISASGGTDKMNIYASFGYLDQEGTQIGQWYNRYTSKLSINITPIDWFEMGATINTSWSNQDYGFSTLGASSSSGPNSIYNAAARIYQYAVPYNEDGSLNPTPGGDGNVLTIINEWDYSTQQRQTLRALASFHATVDFGQMTSALKGLSYRVNFGPDFRHWREGVYIDGQSVNRLGGDSFARLNNRRDFSWTIDNMLTYDMTADEHKIGITLLQTASKWNYEGSSMSAKNVPKASYLWNAMGTIDVLNSENAVGISSYLNDRQLASYMARINYSLKDRYLLTVSGRYDGASQLSEGNKWTFFPSAALGWRVDQEDFMNDASALDQLKLRFGVGRTGNSGIRPYATKGDIQSFLVPFGGAENTQAYATNEPNYTSTQIEMANKELGWEMTTQYNAGVDFSLFKGRLGGALDLYTSYTSDLLMDMNISPITGYESIYANVGETKNKGVDITLNTINVQSKNFSWSTNINAAWQKDEIITLAYGKQDMVDNAWFIGQSILVFYNVAHDGLWQEADAAEMEKFNANGHNFEAGKVKPVDTNDDYLIDAEDRIILGNTMPRWTFGMTNTFDLGNFELSFLLYGRFKYMINTGGEGQLGRYNQRSIDYWTTENTDAEWQKPIYNEAGGDAYSSLLGYREASFLKLRNISLGYNVPRNFTSRYHIDNLKIYVQAKNMGSLYSTVDWLDLDLGGSTFNRGFVFGVNIGF